MKSLDVKHQFINLRAKDESYDKISNKLNVSKQESEYLTQLQDLSVQLQLILDQLIYYKEVIPINDAPEIISIPNENIEINQSFEYVIDVYDPDNDQFIFDGLTSHIRIL